MAVGDARGFLRCVSQAMVRLVSVDTGGQEVVDAELVEDGELVRVEETPAHVLVTQHTVLRPGQKAPTTDDPATNYTTRDLYLSPETTWALEEAEEDGSAPRRTAMNGFKAWSHRRVVSRSRARPPRTPSTAAT